MTTHDISSDSTTEHKLATTTSNGREMVLIVTAGKDITPEAVLNDVKNTLASNIKVNFLEDEEYSEHPILTGLLIWFVIGVFGSFAFILLDSAGWMFSFWPEGIPIIGKTSAGVGFLRAFLSLLPCVLAICFVIL